MKKTLFIMIIAAAAIAFAVCKKDDDKNADTPPLAATTQMWTFGDQIWSDAIQCPECNKETFEDSYTEPQCRSYADPESGKTFYYYNWAYVDVNKNTMCPSPWRVPTREDLETLLATVNASDRPAEPAIPAAWFYGGRANGRSMSDVSSYAYNWASTVYSGNRAFFLGHTSGYLFVTNKDKFLGLQVRCVK